MTEWNSSEVKGIGRGRRVLGERRSDRSQGTVRALVPWKSSSACSSGTLVGAPALFRKGGTGRDWTVKVEVAYFEARKSVEGLRDSKKEHQWWRLASKMAV